MHKWIKCQVCQGTIEIPIPEPEEVTCKHCGSEYYHKKKPTRSRNDSTFQCLCGSLIRPDVNHDIKCHGCGRVYEISPQVTVSRARILATAIIPAVGAAALGGLISGTYPMKEDPPAERRKKISMLTATFTASGFIGMLTGLIATPGGYT